MRARTFVFDVGVVERSQRANLLVHLEDRIAIAVVLDVVFRSRFRVRCTAAVAAATAAESHVGDERN